MSLRMTEPTNWLVCPVKSRISQGIRPIWSGSSLCTQWVVVDPRFLHAYSEDSDQTGWIPRLIWVFAGCTSHFVGFVMLQLIYVNYVQQAGRCQPHMKFTNYVISEVFQTEFIVGTVMILHPFQHYFSHIRITRRRFWRALYNKISSRSSLIWVYSFCSDLSVQKHRVCSEWIWPRSCDPKSATLAILPHGRLNGIS